jgi:putative MATE family efflux protein
MQIKLSDHFTYSRLFRFTIPSIIMMLFTSIYGVVDGLFVSNFAGKQPFTAINLVFPVLMIVGALGFMMGAGGTAIVAKTLGEGDRQAANRYFSLIVYVTLAMGVVMSVIGIIFVRPLSELLGAEGQTLEYCVIYGRITLVAMPCFMLQNLFQSFFIAAEKPKLGLIVTVAAGLTNIILDFLLVAVCKFGLEGAAVATALSQFVGGVVPVFYFARKNTSLLKLTKTAFYGKVLLKSVTNGSSELMSNISASVVTVVYNLQLMKYAGENGVAAYGIIMYISFIFIAIFIGYSIGSAPIVGYNYGAANENEMKNLFKKSIVLMLGIGIAMTILGITLAKPLSYIFVGYDEELFNMTVRGLRIFSLSFILSGVCIFSSSFFTALNNGPISAIVSFMRTLVYQLLGVSLLPLIFKLDGIWFSMLMAELLAFATSVVFLFIYRKRYKYM